MCICDESDGVILAELDKVSLIMVLIVNVIFYFILCVYSRVGIYVNTFQSLAGHQEKFHREMSKVRYLSFCDLNSIELSG